MLTTNFCSGWHMYLVYFALSIVAFVITYLWVQETRGIPVEEIGALFGDEVVVHLTSDGAGIVEDKQSVEQVEDYAAEVIDSV